MKRYLKPSENSRFQSSIVIRSLQILSKRDQKKIVAVTFIQVFLGILDLAGVLIVGIVGSLAITGVSNVDNGNKVGFVLQALRLQERNLQTQVAFLGMIAAATLILKTLISLYFTRKTLYFLSRRSAVLSSTLISKLLGQSLLTVQQRSMQQTIYALTNGVSTISVGVLGTLAYLISDTSLLIILTAGLFVVDTTIALSSLAFFSLVGVSLYRIMHRRIRQLGNLQAELSIQSSEKLTEVLSSYRELVVRNRRYYYADEFGKIRLKLSNIIAENTFRQNISKYVMEMAIVFGSFVIAGIQFSTQTASHAVAVLAIFLAASSRIGPAVLRVQSGLLQIKSSIGSAGPTLDLIEELGSEPSIEKVGDLVETTHVGFIPQVDVSNVTFTYPGKSKPAVRDVTLQFEPGSVVAIVGPSGAGKTTLVDLMLGVIKPDSGSVLISNTDPLESVKLWPGAIAYVPQDVVITNSTIAENITMGFPNSPSHKQLIANSVNLSHLAQFIETLPQKTQSHVGDRGTSLSGGQRQRLGIARALFTNPGLLILDEATSSLDGEMEANISDSINTLKGQVTVVLIAHRLSTVRNVDKVIYMQDGEVRAEGKFEEVRIKVPDFDKQARLMGL